MSSKNSSESIAKDVLTILDHYESLRSKHNTLARETAKGLMLTAELAEQMEADSIKRHKKLVNRISTLGFAIAIQALYLIIML